MTKALLTITIVLSLTALANAVEIFPSNSRSCVSIGPWKWEPISGIGEATVSNTCGTTIYFYQYTTLPSGIKSKGLIILNPHEKETIMRDEKDEVHYCSEYGDASVRKRERGVCPDSY